MTGPAYRNSHTPPPDSARLDIALVALGILVLVLCWWAAGGAG